MILITGVRGFVGSTHAECAVLGASGTTPATIRTGWR